MSYSPISHGGSARVSTLIVDAQLDTGAFGIKADIIEESTPAAGVGLPDGVNTDTIRENTAGVGTSIDDIHSDMQALSMVASDTTRSSSAGPFTFTTAAYAIGPSRKVPERYTQPGSVRIKWTCTASAYNMYSRIYVDGVAVGAIHTTAGGAVESYEEDVLGLTAGNVVQLYARSQYIVECTITDASTSADDIIVHVPTIVAW